MTESRGTKTGNRTVLTLGSLEFYRGLHKSPSASGEEHRSRWQGTEIDTF